MKHLNLFFVAVFAIMTAFAVAACSNMVSKNVAEKDEVTSSQETSESTSASEATPTPVPTPTNVPTPTPVPEYIEPLFDETWYGDYVDPRSVRAQVVSNPDDITVLVNKYFSLPLDYVPSDLVDAPYSNSQQLRSEASQAWEQMHDACFEATGENVILLSGYRDSSLQEYLFTRSANNRGTDFACMKNAWAGRSEHQLGLALDLTPASESTILDDFSTTTVGSWINEHCYEYGFIERYTDEFALETGYADEDWHYRYVGVELATELTQQNISLERYYDATQRLPADE